MQALKWFSGGRERRERAILLIDKLFSENGDKSNTPLYRLLSSYRQELESDGASIPYILSRMNVDISKVVLKGGTSLSESESTRLKELRGLLYSRTPFVKMPHSE